MHILHIFDISNIFAYVGIFEHIFAYLVHIFAKFKNFANFLMKISKILEKIYTKFKLA
jgi:hypothetical protein